MKNLVLLILLNISPAIYAQEMTEYIIKVSPDNPYKINVLARFTSIVDTLSIHPACPNYDYPNGWSSFIKPISKDLVYIGNAKWKTNNKKEISYNVDLSFVKEKWDVGNEQAGAHIDQSIFIVTRALFLTFHKDEKFKVKFILPKDYSIAAPWQNITTNQYLVNSLEALNNNTLVWGKQETKTIAVDNFNLEIALLGYDKSTYELVRETFYAVLKQYLDMFPETPQSNYLITVWPFEQNDGEAYTTSHAFTLRSPITAKNKVIWANQFAHELFHFWNGRMINGPERQARQWFSEGFTEYFANLALVRSKAISKTEFYRLIEKTIGLYFYYKNRQYPKVNLVEAGFKKSKYRFGVYNAGWGVAFVMDMMIREKYPDKTLEDFMHLLFEKYGLTDKDYVLEQLEKEFQEFYKEDNNFFQQYIYGLDELPIEKYLNKAGIQIDYTSYEGTAFLFDMIQPSKEQKELKIRWLRE